MKSIKIFSFIAIILISCKSQPKSKPSIGEFSFSDVGWKIQIPSDFEIMDSSQIDALNSKGTKAIEKTYDTTINFKSTKTLISAKKGQFNYFASTLTPFDPKQDGKWMEANEGLKILMVETFNAQAPNMKVDTSSAVEMIGGLEFQKFKIISTFPNKMVLTTLMYSKFYKGYDFGINISYSDEKVGKELMDILASSKFDR